MRRKVYVTCKPMQISLSALMRVLPVVRINGRSAPMIFFFTLVIMRTNFGRISKTQGEHGPRKDDRYKCPWECIFPMWHHETGRSISDIK